MQEQFIITKQNDLRRLISDEINKALDSASPAKEDPQKEVYTNKEAMNFLGVSRSTLQRWRENEILPFRKINGSIRYTRDDLKKMLENSRG